MKSLFYIFILIVVLMIFGNKEVNAQATQPNNNTGVGNFLGFNGAQDLDFRTNNILRMQLQQTQNSTINNNFNVNTSGFLGLSNEPNFFTTGPQSPFSLLHLNSDNSVGAQQGGYRDWMRGGIVFTHNQDLMYVGPMKNGAMDVTDAVVSWSDNTGGGVGPDNLRFIFTGGDGNTISQDLNVNDDLDGREIMRMKATGEVGVGSRWTNANQPKKRLDIEEAVDGNDAQLRITHTPSFSGNELNGKYTDLHTDASGHFYIRSKDNAVLKNVGIGLTSPDAPTERIDVLGTARLRVMTNPQPDVLITGLRFDDEVGDHVLHYLDFSNDPGTVLSGDGTWVALDDCEWNEVLNNGTSEDLVMGYPGACNEGRVGIGISVPQSKLHVQNSMDESNATVRVRSTNSNNPSVQHFGLDCMSFGGGDFQVAVAGEAQATSDAPNTPPTNPLVGVRGIARANGFCGHAAVGVYGEAFGPSTCGGVVAGYFAGSVVQFGPTLFGSDAALKTNIEDYSGGLDAVLALKPKTYELNNEVLHFATPGDVQYGLLAQDVREILPDLVNEIPALMTTNEEGGMDVQEDTYLGVKYVELIPVLISAIQEQQAQINSLNELVAACCAVNADQRSGDTSPANDIQLAAPAGKQSALDQNFPNPFTDATSIRFSLATDCQTRVCIYNSAGQQIDCLVNESRSAGEHQVDWDTTGLAPGIYFYSLECDGFEQVRRAVKL